VPGTHDAARDAQRGELVVEQGLGFTGGLLAEKVGDATGQGSDRGG
jgi:hypothetical protein